MKVRVLFRFNRTTGEVEEFRVDDVGDGLPRADHDRQHEQIATDLARRVDRNPRLIELSGDAIPPPRIEPVAGEATEQDQKDPTRTRTGR